MYLQLIKHQKVILLFYIFFRIKTNASLQTVLSLTMWARNHTLECRINKDPEESDRVLNLASVKNQDIK